MEKLLCQLSFTSGNTESQNLNGADFILSLSLPEASWLATFQHAHTHRRAHTHMLCTMVAPAQSVAGTDTTVLMELRRHHTHI